MEECSNLKTFCPLILSLWFYFSSTFYHLFWCVLHPWDSPRQLRYVSLPCVLLIRFAGVELRTFAPLCLVCHWLTVSLFDYSLRITVLS